MKIFWADFRKVVLNSYFLLSALVVFLLCFTSNIYTDTSSGRTYTVFEALTSIDKVLISKETSFASINVIKNAFSGYNTMFMPIIAALPFMISFCTERSSGFMRFQITRCGRWKYYLSKFMAVLISGGLAVLTGVLLFAAVTNALFPPLSSYDVSESEIALTLPGGEMTVFVRLIIAAFAYGAVSTFPAFLISSFSRNPYLITCIPFMLDYIRDTGVKKILSAGVEKGDISAFNKYGPFLSNAITGFINSFKVDELFIKTLAVSLGSAAAAFFGFVFFMEIRIDKGA